MAETRLPYEHRDLLVGVDIRATSYRYGRSHTDTGIQITLESLTGPTTGTILAGRLPREHALALAQAILAVAEPNPVHVIELPGRRCGNCWYRRNIGYHNRSFAKCTFGYENPTDNAPRETDPPRATHSAASDVRSWWPACTDHSYGDPRLSDDAARWVPGGDR